MSLRNTFNTIQIDCRYPIHYIFRETRKELFNFSLKKNLTNQIKRENDQIQIACSKGGGGRVLQLHGPRLRWQLVFRGILFFSFFYFFWQLVFSGNSFFSFVFLQFDFSNCILRCFISSNSFLLTWVLK